MMGRRWLRWIGLAAALAILDASLTFHNIWPTPFIRWTGEFSVELAACILMLVLATRSIGSRSRTWLAGLSVLWILSGHRSIRGSYRPGPLRSRHQSLLGAAIHSGSYRSPGAGCAGLAHRRCRFRDAGHAWCFLRTGSVGLGAHRVGGKRAAWKTGADFGCCRGDRVVRRAAALPPRAAHSRLCDAGGSDLRAPGSTRRGGVGRLEIASCKPIDELRPRARQRR